MTGPGGAGAGSPEFRWRTDLFDDEQRQIQELIAAAREADGVAPVGDQVLRELAHDRTRHLLALDDDTVVGYLDLTPASEAGPPMAELVVHPRRRRHGIGSALARAALAEGGSGTRIWAHGHLEPARGMAKALGLTPVRELLQMRRPLTDLPPETIPAGMRIDIYRGPQDDAALLRINNAAFAWHPEQRGWTPADIAERRAEPWFDADGLLMAYDEDTGSLLGFHWTKVHNETLGEVYVVGVDPAAQGRGIGAALTLAGLHHLAEKLSEADRPVVMLYVEADNSAAVNTYRRLGFVVSTSDVAYAIE